MKPFDLLRGAKFRYSTLTFKLNGVTAFFFFVICTQSLTRLLSLSHLRLSASLSSLITAITIIINSNTTTTTTTTLLSHLSSQPSQPSTPPPPPTTITKPKSKKQRNNQKHNLRKLWNSLSVTVNSYITFG